MRSVPVRVRLIDDIVVERDGVAIELPQSKKTLALMAYLLWTGRGHRRSQLAGLLWCDVDDPRGGLRWSLSKVRALLDDPERRRVLANREEVTIDASDVEIDAAAIRRVARDVTGASTDELAAALDGIGDGGFLDALDLSDCPDFHAWCVAAGEEVRRARVAVLAELVDRLHDREPERAAEYARRWVRLDRDDDRAQAALVRVLAACGRSREAEEQVRAHRRWLADRGRKPSPRLHQAWQTALSGPPASGAAPDSEELFQKAPVSQELRFCTGADGVRIAYALSGDGPPLVKTTNWMSHLEREWTSPLWRHWLDELGRGRTLVRYDQRGNGLSDPEVEDLSFEAFVRDLETVVDTLGLERFPLFGISQGCAVAVAYAALHPERVSHLILVAGFVRGWRVRGNPSVVRSTEALMTLMRHGWGMDNPAFRQTFTTLFFPEATPEVAREFNEMQRRTTSPDNAARLMSSFGDFDAAEQLARVRAPTLVVHSRHDALIPFSWGREMAAGIPGARFVPLESHNHLLLREEPAWGRFVTELRRFLGEPDRT